MFRLRAAQIIPATFRPTSRGGSIVAVSSRQSSSIAAAAVARASASWQDQSSAGEWGNAAWSVAAGLAALGGLALSSTNEVRRSDFVRTKFKIQQRNFQSMMSCTHRIVICFHECIPTARYRVVLIAVALVALPASSAPIHLVFSFKESAHVMYMQICVNDHRDYTARVHVVKIANFMLCRCYEEVAALVPVLFGPDQTKVKRITCPKISLTSLLVCVTLF